MPRIACSAVAALFMLGAAGATLGQDQPASVPPAQPSPVEPKPDVQPLTGEQVLARMAEVYQTCKTYQDHGEVSILFDTNMGKWTDTRPFKTAFVRPDKLRFEFTSRSGPRSTGPDHLFVVWADGKKIQSWWDLNKQREEHDTIETALAGPTGVSGKSAITIPTMLLSLNWGAKLSDLRAPKVAAEEEIENTACYRIEGNDLSGDPVVLWVEKERFLVRKIFEKRKIQDFTTEQTTIYSPKVDEPIADETFTFDPKAKRENKREK